MTSDDADSEEKVEFGPFLSRLYSFFATRTGGHRKIYSTIARDAVKLNPATILEIGCGPGMASAMIARELPGSTITCVDPSPTMIDIANRRFEKLSIDNRVKGVVGSSANTSVEGKFDLIFTSISFHHWKDPEGDLEKLVKNHLGHGTLIIYENLVSTSGEKSAHRHGISLDYAKGLEIPGTEKTYSVQEDLIIVRLNSRKLPRE